ncbi:MAG: 7-cyano-7-deazaguanine synthase QueC [Gammaproteobacteria bacterium]|nr:7-cyano-7-deazaguanine synthase QueC [Gammaproteobacteria bacterium]
MKKAVILVSGGLDSATVLAIAQAAGYTCYAVSFDYGQRHSAELEAARQVAARAKVEEHRIVSIDLSQFGGSALTDESIDVPDANTSEDAIPITYVPARNTVFLSLALAWSEVLGACDIFVGVNAVDYSGYPDCRPEFIRAYENMANLATRAGVEEQQLTVHAPLIDLTKAQIVQQGNELGVDYSLTVSCYQADATGAACGVCDSCFLRREGFANAGIADPTRYQ